MSLCNSFRITSEHLFRQNVVTQGPTYLSKNEFLGGFSCQLLTSCSNLLPLNFLADTTPPSAISKPRLKNMAENQVDHVWGEQRSVWLSWFFRLPGSQHANPKKSPGSSKITCLTNSAREPRDPRSESPDPCEACAGPVHRPTRGQSAPDTTLAHLGPPKKAKHSREGS